MRPYLFIILLLCSVFLAGCTTKEDTTATVQPEALDSGTNNENTSVPTNTSSIEPSKAPSWFVCPDGRTVNTEADCSIFCQDGTVNYNCSTTKPKYCKNGSLIDMPVYCGCPDGFKLEISSEAPIACIEIKPLDQKYCPHLQAPSGGLEPSYDERRYVGADILNQVKWDGWEWEKDVLGYASLVCNKGANKGENINYLYCENPMGFLKKSFADENGTVQNKVIYYMVWIYSPSGSSYKLKEIQYCDDYSCTNDPICTSQYE
ncbi:MAG: hypothetical protein M1530_02350 [Candidatus Marsarchaeota archaeon]|nr:hypothetical protein [Candidatus Marsarchaeota archaeon]